jgi:hypothetical protein
MSLPVFTISTSTSKFLTSCKVCVAKEKVLLSKKEFLLSKKICFQILKADLVSKERGQNTSNLGKNPVPRRLCLGFVYLQSQNRGINLAW